MRATERLVGVEDNTERAERGGYMSKNFRQEGIELLSECGAVTRKGLDFTRVFRSRRVCADLARLMLEFWHSQGVDIPHLTVLSGPCQPSGMLGQSIRRIGAGKIQTEFAVMDKDSLVLSRSADDTLCKGPVLLLRTVLTAQDSTVLRAIAAVRAVGGKPLGVLCVENQRQSWAPALGVPVYALLSVDPSAPFVEAGQSVA